jgi:signal transduction histidine kinase
MAKARRSAAYRIASVYAAAFAAAILLLGTAVYFAADAEFRGQRDDHVAAELRDLTQEPGGTPGLMTEIAERERWHGHLPESFGYALFDRAGRRIAGAVPIPYPELGFATIATTGAAEWGSTVRVKATDLPGGNRLAVALDAASIETIDATILSLFGAAFAGVLVVGLAGALLLGRYLRHRLGGISRTAEAVVAGDLTQRMPVSAARDEFDAVALALNAMLDRIAGLMENLRQVSSDVAHDLRTPLLRLRARLEDVGRVEGAAERAIEQGDALLQLFSAILRIAEVEGGGLEQGFTLLDLSALVLDVGESFQPALSDSGHDLAMSIAPDLQARGNRELLAQAIANLLDNVRAHTPPGTGVRLDLSATAGGARITVADDGPGVPPGERTAILRRFYRGEASRTTPGNGLGLSLVEAVAAAHGGTVSIEDALPGLVVAVTLPRMA